MSRTGFRFEMTPWKLYICSQSWADCEIADADKPLSWIYIRDLPEAPEPGRIPPGADHVHIVAKYSGERDAREEEKWRALVKSAARCPHGRLMLTPCRSCPEGTAPDYQGQLFGTTANGRMVSVPSYEDLDNISAWIDD